MVAQAEIGRALVTQADLPVPHPFHRFSVKRVGNSFAGLPLLTALARCL